MRLTTLKTSESDVSALTQRLYPNLSEVKRKQVETALLKANPHLSETNAFRPGVVVTLPTMPDVKPKPGVVGDDPVDEMRSGLKEAVLNYKDGLDKRLDEALIEVTSQEELLKQKEVAAAIKATPDAAELAQELTASLRERKKTLAEQKKTQAETFAKIVDDIGSLLN
jgi:phage tail protein X